MDNKKIFERLIPEGGMSAEGTAEMEMMQDGLSPEATQKAVPMQELLPAEPNEEAIAPVENEPLPETDEEVIVPLTDMVQRRRKIIGILAGSLALAAAAAYFILSALFAFVGEGIFGYKLVRENISELSFNGKRFEYINNLEKLDDLQKLDIRGCSITKERFDEIRKILPDCEILWDVPLGAKSFDCGSRAAAIDDKTDIKNLEYFTALSEVDANACTDYSMLTAAREMYPEIVFKWNVTVEGKDIPWDTTDVRLSAKAQPEDINALRRLPNIKSVDATECTLYDDLLKLHNEVSSCDVEWIVDIDGQKISSLDEKVYFTGHKISDETVVSDALKYLPCIKYMEMCGCGLKDEQMEILRDSFPDIKFVWTINFLSFKNVRTDIQVFSTLYAMHRSFTEEDYEPLLKYCTDLVALDLGHNSIRSLEGFRNLKKLKFLILSDNYIVDISPLAELSELELLEIPVNFIRDFSPLNGLENLHYVALGQNTVQAYNTIFGLKAPIYISLCGREENSVPNSVKEKLKETYPNAKKVYYADGMGAGMDWRHTDFYRGYRICLANWRSVEYCNSWNDYKFVDGAEIITPVKY